MAIHNQTSSQKRRGGGIKIQRFFMDIHVNLYRWTGGAIGGKLAGRPMLLLTTTGRKSGQERITPILYVADAERYILIASNGGAAQHPQWWFNLQKQPQAKVQIGRDVIAVTAQTATGEERQRLWSLVTTRYPEFAGYQRRTTREIPVVILTPQTK